MATQQIFENTLLDATLMFTNQLRQLSLAVHRQQASFKRRLTLQEAKQIRQLIMLRHTAGIKTLKSKLENLNSDISITTEGWTSMAQDSYCTITGKSHI